MNSTMTNGMRLRWIIFLALLNFCQTFAWASAHAQPAQTELLFFYGRGCQYCAAMNEFLAEMEVAHPQLAVREYEVYFSPENASLFTNLAQAYGVEVEGVPTVFLGDDVIPGYAPELAPVLEDMIVSCINRQCASPLVRIQGHAGPTSLTLPAVLLGAAVDAINPCEFAVLIILITAILAAGGRGKALRAGLAFSLSIFISYYLMGIGLYSAVEAAGIARGIYVGVPALAILIGLFNLKDFLWYGRWFVMEVPPSWRPALKNIIGKVTSVPGAFFTGFVVSLFLLPCTSGPYIVILGLLAETETRASAFLWLLLYNAIFVSPMVLITLGVYFGFTTVEKAEAWRTRNLQVLHLIAGAILVLLGAGMFVALRMGAI